MNTDITRIRFGKKVSWSKSNRFKVVDEEKLEEKMNNRSRIDTTEDLRLGGIITIYRNLRENYEYSLRYEEADQFYKREMEVKRLYREKILENKDKKGYTYIIIRNNRFRRNLSLTGLYYNISSYGTNIIKPALLAVLFVSLPILYEVIRRVFFTKEGVTQGVIANTTTGALTNIFRIPEGQDVIGFFIGIATITILGTLFVAALKRKFEKKFRQ
jgi:hypothetical protein